MAKGDVYPSEKRTFKEKDTDVTVIQLTDNPSHNKNFYYNQEQFIAGSERYVFLSDRSGVNQIYAADVKTGEIVQLTDSEEGAGGCSVDHLAGIIYFTRGKCLYSIDAETLAEEVVGMSPEGCGGSSYIWFGSYTRQHPMEYQTIKTRF